MSTLTLMLVLLKTSSTDFKQVYHNVKFVAKKSGQLIKKEVKKL